MNELVITTPEETNILTLPSNYTEMPLSELPSVTLAPDRSQQSSHCLMPRPKSQKKLIRKQVSSQLLKKNILRSRYSHRIQKLKEVTRDNLQMFLRIKAQQSHYSLKTVQPQFCRQKCMPKDIPAESVPKSFRLRCRSANLLSKCSELKETIVKDKRTGATSSLTSYCQDNCQKNIHKKVRIIRVGSASNKENQGNNSIKHTISEQLYQDLQKKALSKKLCFEGSRIQNLKLSATDNPRSFFKKEGPKSHIQSKLIVLANEVNGEGRERRMDKELAWNR